MSEKLQKVLADCGFGSRRQMEAWIREGRVKINARLAKIGDRVSEKERIVVNGKVVQRDKSAATRVLLLNKPAGVICTRRDPQERQSVFELLPKIKNDRWILVGRLDINTSGLLLVTTNGLLAQRLMHPSYEIEREYMVRVFGEVTPEIISRLKSGVDIDGETMGFARIKAQAGSGKNQWYQVCLKEGKYREIRRLWESQGIKVNRLIRTRFANIPLPHNLRQGGFRELHRVQLDKLMNQVGLSEFQGDEVESGERVGKKAAGRKPTTKKSVSKKPMGKKPTSEKPTSKKPTSKKPTSKKPTSKKPTSKKPTNKKPTSKKPTSKKPTSKKPAGKKPAGKKPAGKKPTGKKPRANKKPGNR